MRELIRKIVRRVYRALIPTRVKNTLRVWLVFEEQDKPPVELTSFAVERVLVFAPHMDDEVIGCGGAIRRHTLSGAPVTVVFLTDGRRGDPTIYGGELSTEEVREKEAVLVATRKDEALRSAERLGIAETIFLDRPDGNLSADVETVDRLAALLREKNPNVAYLPSLLDAHSDHWATNVAFLEAARRAGEDVVRDLVIREYEVWSPLLPNRIVDIGSVQAEKMAALAEYRSQIAQVNYLRVVEGLNMYRSAHIDSGSGFAEAFSEGSFERYAAVMDRYSRR